MTLSGVWGSNFSFVLEKWLPGQGYFASEICVNMGDNIRENNIKIDYTGWFEWYIRWYNGGV